MNMTQSMVDQKIKEMGEILSSDLQLILTENDIIGLELPDYLVNDFDFVYDTQFERGV